MKTSSSLSQHPVANLRGTIDFAADLPFAVDDTMVGSGRKVPVRNKCRGLKRTTSVLSLLNAPVADVVMTFSQKDYNLPPTLGALNASSNGATGSSSAAGARSMTSDASLDLCAHGEAPLSRLKGINCRSAISISLECCLGVGIPRRLDSHRPQARFNAIYLRLGQRSVEY